MSSDLVSRLFAAIEETEQDALAAANGETWVQWARIADLKSLSAGSGTSWDARPCIETATEAIAEHIQHHDPAAVLRRCTADRNTIGMCQAAMKQYERGESDTSGYTLAMMVLVHLHEAYGISVEEETTGE